MRVGVDLHLVRSFAGGKVLPPWGRHELREKIMGRGERIHSVGICSPRAISSLLEESAAVGAWARKT